MYTGLLHLHNLMRWVILLLLVIAIVNAMLGIANKRQYTSGNRKVALFLMISAHITLLIGLYQWIAGPLGLKLIQANGMGAVMKDSVARFWAVEHLTGMLIGIILITVANSVSKKNISPEKKHTKTLWLYLVALVIIFASVPWPFREVARPLFPGM